eukprot:4564157-Pleurochrysis_carterae.AAC.1
MLSVVATPSCAGAATPSCVLRKFCNPIPPCTFLISFPPCDGDGGRRAINFSIASLARYGGEQLVAVWLDGVEVVACVTL